MQLLYRCSLSCHTATLISQATPTSAQPSLPPSLALPLSAPAVSRASVSQHGPAVMAFSDTLSRAMAVAAASAALQDQGDTNITGFQAAGVVRVAGWGAGWRGRGTTNECTEVPRAHPQVHAPLMLLPFHPHCRSCWLWPSGLPCGCCGATRWRPILRTAGCAFAAS